MDIQVKFGHAVASRSGFAARTAVIKREDVHANHVDGLVMQGVAILAQRLFSADKDAKISKTDYDATIDQFLSCIKDGTDWRKRGGGPGKPIDWTNRALVVMVNAYLKAKGLDAKTHSAKVAAAIMAKQADLVAQRAKEMQAVHEAAAAIDDLDLDIEAPFEPEF